ncbi:FxLD family lanthipeptide [Actinorugispora endophytica]|uniref:FxLD family lantipeptide n=1 Tax=Actinorugispora endophytica TaxID=1605990 RepID=A0A4V3D749_9ACTN|nr:FxLD family lanthipeptide [Actinorugispora endophytica]TDQ46317.1 FxLD family lantipeptide [Actinorugispora endophytica]
MSTPTIEQPTTGVAPVPHDSGAGEGPGAADPFAFDIGFIEGTPASESILACSTGDTCGSSCPSACATS